MIRALKKKDITILRIYEKNFFNYDLTLDFWLKILLGQLPYLYYVHTYWGKITSYLSVSVISDEAEIHSLATLPHFRKRGHAQKLMQHIITHLKTINVVRIYLDCRVSNQKAINLYTKLGFKNVGLRPNYYQNEDGIIFLKEL